jgi:hypothetical protein
MFCRSREVINLDTAQNGAVSEILNESLSRGQSVSVTAVLSPDAPPLED